MWDYYSLNKKQNSNTEDSKVTINYKETFTIDDLEKHNLNNSLNSDENINEIEGIDL